MSRDVIESIILMRQSGLGITYQSLASRRLDCTERSLKHSQRSFRSTVFSYYLSAPRD